MAKLNICQTKVEMSPISKILKGMKTGQVSFILCPFIIKVQRPIAQII